MGVPLLPFIFSTPLLCSRTAASRRVRAGLAARAPTADPVGSVQRAVLAGLPPLHTEGTEEVAATVDTVARDPVAPVGRVSACIVLE